MNKLFYKIVYLDKDTDAAITSSHSSDINACTGCFPGVPNHMSWADLVEEEELLYNESVLPPWSFEMPSNRPRRNNKDDKDKNKQAKNNNSNNNNRADSDNDSVFETVNEAAKASKKVGRRNKNKESTNPQAGPPNTAPGPSGASRYRAVTDIQRNLINIAESDVAPVAPGPAATSSPPEIPAADPTEAPMNPEINPAPPTPQGSLSSFRRG